MKKRDELPSNTQHSPKKTSCPATRSTRKWKTNWLLRVAFTPKDELPNDTQHSQDESPSDMQHLRM